MRDYPQHFNVGDMVELFSYIRKPKLKGIIIKDLGYSEKIDDYVFEVFAYAPSFQQNYKWSQRTLHMLSKG